MRSANVDAHDDVMSRTRRHMMTRTILLTPEDGILGRPARHLEHSLPRTRNDRHWQLARWRHHRHDRADPRRSHSPWSSAAPSASPWMTSRRRYAAG